VHTLLVYPFFFSFQNITFSSATIDLGNDLLHDWFFVISNVQLN